MSRHQREYDIEDATEDAVDLYEIPLIDLSEFFSRPSNYMY